MSSQGLTAGVVLHEVATTDIVYEGCKVLYSEDLQHGQLIDRQLRVVNPFSTR